MISSVITSIKQKVQIKSDKYIFEELNKSPFLHSYIPDASIIKGVESYVSASLTIVNNKELSFSFDHGKGILECELGKNININAIITVIDYCLEYARQLEGSYCLHGSAVSIDNKGLLIIGGVSGLGKTTLALNLCLQEHFSFIGDDKIVIDNNFRIVGGCKRIEYNKPSLQKSIPYNVNGLATDDLQKLFTISTLKTPLTLGIQPVIIPDGNLEVEEWNEEKINFHVYEELTKKIRGTSKRVNNFSYPLMSIDTFELAQKRSDYAKHIASTIPFYTIKGDIRIVMEYIKELF